MATLTVTHTETLTLGDGDGTERGTTNVQTITVDQVDSRIVGVPTLGLSFLSFGTMPAAGTFQYSKVKYLRITNIDPTNFLTWFKNSSVLRRIFMLVWCEAHRETCEMGRRTQRGVCLGCART